MIMAGWVTKSTRRGSAYADAPIAVKGASETIRPGRYSDGQTQQGTPARNEHYSKAPGNSPGYLDAAGQRYRDDLGSQSYPGMGDSHRGGENPQVHSRDSMFHGRPHTPGKVASPGEQAKLSGGRLAGK